MEKLDLDKARAARAETNGEAKQFILGGNTFTLPAELPYKIGELLTSARITDAIEVLLGAEQMKKFDESAPSNEDITALLEGITKLYGFSGGPGESEGSLSS